MKDAVSQDIVYTLSQDIVYIMSQDIVYKCRLNSLTFTSI